MQAVALHSVRAGTAAGFFGLVGRGRGTSHDCIVRSHAVLALIRVKALSALACEVLRMSEQVDVIIIGAGPAGLSLAAELAPHVRVLVLERREVGHTAASWYSYADRVRDHGLDEAVAFPTDHGLFRSPNFAHRLVDDCVVLDHHEVLRIWHERAVAHGARFVHADYSAHHVAADGVVVRSTAGEHHARLLVDCSGSHSKIVAAQRLIKRKNAWVLYGARIRLPRPASEVGIAYVPLGDEANTYLGIHPFSDSELNVYLFQGQLDTLGHPTLLRPLFEKTLARMYPGAQVVEPLGGSIVSGVLSRYAFERVVFFGAAGMMNPDAIGMGFNEILRKVRQFATGLRDLLDRDRLGGRELERLALLVRDREVLHFQRVIGAFSLHFVTSPDKWDGGVRWLNLLGPASRQWMRNELTPEWLVKATLALHRAVPFRESVKMIPLQDLGFVCDQLVRYVAKAGAGRARARFRRAVHRPRRIFDRRPF